MAIPAMMKKILLACCGSLLSGAAYADAVSGQIGITLTIEPQCTVRLEAAAPRAECSHATAQPNIIHSPPAQENGVAVILVEW
ncbi:MULTISPECIES: hypothetical protein [Serratia]|jgi:hypothetical protein|uniref:hypothetical protein n=1 Tax=Serratia TaxID=613 RepID=UPI000AB29DAE|nr:MULTISPECIES: hypothetical protein [Serratia]AWC78842.1 hypothetical protein AM377_03750 [Serratia marcescens]EMB2349820.1 hypothetical protein [Serratia marcescens]MBH2639747.1 hypothetical protein [Serratia ureilytica]MBH2687896.1 hypothetical protein [Serratia ureilytica]MBH3008586.1 hypothetical protein [Serratia ureilytica]